MLITGTLKVVGNGMEICSKNNWKVVINGETLIARFKNTQGWKTILFGIQDCGWYDKGSITRYVSGRMTRSLAKSMVREFAKKSRTHEQNYYGVSRKVKFIGMCD